MNNNNNNDSQGKVEQLSVTLRNYAQQTCHSIEQAVVATWGREVGKGWSGVNCVCSQCVCRH